MSKYWRILLTPLYPLLLVNALVAYLYAILWCRARDWKVVSGTLTFIAAPRGGDLGHAGGSEGSRMAGNPGGQGWSWIVGYASEWHREQADLRCHENTHVWQELVWAAGGLALATVPALLGHWGLATLIAFSGGPVWALVYAGSFLVNFARTGFADWYAAYMAIPFETHAYRVQEEYLAGERPNAWT